MDQLPRLVHFLLGENGDEKFPAMATHSMLADDALIRASDLPEALELLGRFIPSEDMEPDHWERVQRTFVTLPSVWAGWPHLVDDESMSIGRAAAILWSDERSTITPLVDSEHDLDRALLALSAIPGTDAARLWRDESPLVRIALMFGHGPMCPICGGSDADDDVSADVRAAAASLAESWRSDEPGIDYRCPCPRPSREVEQVSAEDLMTQRAGTDEWEAIEARFAGLAVVLAMMRASLERYAESGLGQRLLHLHAVARAARDVREECRRLGLAVDAYNDAMVMYSVFELVSLSFADEDRRVIDEHQVDIASDLGLDLLWLGEDAFAHDLPGDWVKRLSGAIETLRLLDPLIAERMDERIGRAPAELAEWLVIPEGETWVLHSRSWNDDDDDDQVDGSSPGAGAGILNFHQAMWLVEGESPLALEVERWEDVPPVDRHWGDQPDFEQLLPAAWHARRTDDWSSFTPLVSRLASLEPMDRFSGDALNHLLLYAGDGQHPLSALGELLSGQEEYAHLGGFTHAFRECWLPILADMWCWWQESSFAPHALAGTPASWVDEDLATVDDLQCSVDTADPMHLSMHGGAPLGESGGELDDRGLEDVDLLWHEPTVVTITVPTYRLWMRVLRTMKLRRPTIARVMISEEEPPEGTTLGFWLVQPMREGAGPWRNHARFLTDDAAQAVLTLVREWTWESPSRDSVGPWSSHS